MDSYRGSQNLKAKEVCKWSHILHLMPRWSSPGMIMSSTKTYSDLTGFFSNMVSKHIWSRPVVELFQLSLAASNLPHEFYGKTSVPYHFHTKKWTVRKFVHVRFCWPTPDDIYGLPKVSHYFWWSIPKDLLRIFPEFFQLVLDGFLSWLSILFRRLFQFDYGLKHFGWLAFSEFCLGKILTIWKLHV